MSLPQGTTPEIKYKFRKFIVTDIIIAYLSIRQNGKTLVEMDLDDAIEVSATDNSITWRLSQNDTIKFNPNDQLEVQVKYKTNTGIVGTSVISYVDSYEDIKGEVI